MAEKQTQNAEFQPSEADGIRMAVIEYRTSDEHKWSLWKIYDNALEGIDDFLRGRCETLARHFPRCEYRYRLGTLTLEPSDNCEIFKSE